MPTTASPRRGRDLLLATVAVGAVALVPPLVAAGSPAGAIASAASTGSTGSTTALPARLAAPASPLALLGVDPVGAEVADARLASIVSRAQRAWVIPVAVYEVTARFGEAGPSWQFRHTGLDFKAPTGTPVRAVTDARVAAVAYHPLYGRMVVLATASGATLWYCHLSRVSVAQGDLVRAGQRVGRIGTTGNSSGPHLHFEVRVADRPTDPEYYLFGTHRGHTTRPPGWLPPQPITTVAALAAQNA